MHCALFVLKLMGPAYSSSRLEYAGCAHIWIVHPQSSEALVVGRSSEFKQNDRPAETITRLAYMFTTMDGEQNGRGSRIIWTEHRCVPVRTAGSDR